MDDDTKSHLESEQRLYESERARYISISNETGRLLDKSMLAMSSGAFGVSILVAKDLGAANSAICATFLAISWWALSFAVLGCVTSLIATAHANDKMRQILDDEASLGVERIMARAFARFPEIRSNRIVTFSDWIGRISLAVGIIALSLAATVAVAKKGDQHESGNGKQGWQRIEKDRVFRLGAGEPNWKDGQPCCSPSRQSVATSEIKAQGFAEDQGKVTECWQIDESAHITRIASQSKSV